MKKVLAVVIAVAFISMGASIAGAQVPNFTVYFDNTFYQQQAHCEDHVINQPDTLYVVLNNFNMWVNTVEYAIDNDCVPANRLQYWGEQHVNNPLWQGTTSVPGPTGDPSGVTVTWQIPQNAFGPFLCTRIFVTWKCDVCSGPPCPIIVVPHTGPGSGLLAIEWLTFRIVNGVGMTSLICPGAISTEETSWGKMKALYAN